ncbi:hypothetical protein FQN60_015869 [Etheostoma spectabile]|uniref:Uncharacterized protein n=1 Tax=Etheostoma spectabile TaxID=54343 RepID=A0A5J5CR66_9PERO|nr:hypothetical protein FQN60_015869 [Etheostoma spectabile]
MVWRRQIPDAPPGFISIRKPQQTLDGHGDQARGGREGVQGRGELVIPVLVEDPIDIPSVSTRSPFIPLPPTLHPVLTIIETTKESLAMATEAGDDVQSGSTRQCSVTAQQDVIL